MKSLQNVYDRGKIMHGTGGAGSCDKAKQPDYGETTHRLAATGSHFYPQEGQPSRPPAAGGKRQPIQRELESQKSK